MVTNRAASGRTQNAMMMRHVTGDTSNDSAFDAPRGLRRTSCTCGKGQGYEAS